MKDHEIVDLYWQRNEDAIKETSAKYGTFLSKIAFNVLSDFEDSQECINYTYLAAWNSMPEHRSSVLSTYLSKITRQLAIDVFRKRSSLKRYASEYVISLTELEDCFADDQTPEQILDAKLLDEKINTFLRTLPEDVRQVFIGRYYFFDSVKTVVSYCGISEANAKKHSVSYPQEAERISHKGRLCSMKNRIIDSIGNIDADMIENVAALRQQKRRKSTWHRWGAIAACLLLIAAIALPLFSGKNTVSPFVIKAYATGLDGSILEQEMAEGVSFPVTVITADDGTSGFLFSIGEMDSKQPASVSILTAGEYGDASISHMMEFAGLELMPGRSYVFFVGDLSEFGNLTIVHRNEDGTVRAEVTISITESVDGYTARLEKLTSHPVQGKI